MKEIIDNISLQEFIELVNLDDKLIVLDFFAEWCGPCKRLTPFLEQCSVTFKDVHFYKVDVDNNDDICQQFDIKCMPTIVFIKNKKIENKLVGLSQEIIKEGNHDYEVLDKIEGIDEIKILKTIEELNKQPQQNPLLNSENVSEKIDLNKINEKLT